MVTAASPSISAPVALRAPRPKVNKWLVTVSITFGTLMGAIDSSIVSVALPKMMGTLGVTVQEITDATLADSVSFMYGGAKRTTDVPATETNMPF